MSEVLSVAQRGEDILRLVASPVSEDELSSRWLKAFVEALHATMLARQGVGIAAPQVYISKRIIIVASRPNLRYPDAPFMEPTIMINPEILSYSSETILGEEGCLSVQGERAAVSRADRIRVRYLNLEAELVENEYSGFVARIIQHEVDHLNGILFVDRVEGTVS